MSAVGHAIAYSASNRIIFLSKVAHTPSEWSFSTASLHFRSNLRAFIKEGLSLQKVLHYGFDWRYLMHHSSATPES